MAGTDAMAAALFPAKIPRRWIARLATWRGTSRRIWWQRESRGKRKCSLRMRWRGGAGFRDGRHVWHVEDFGRQGQRADSRVLHADAEGHHRNARSAPADLQADGGLRTLWPERAGIQLGADGPRRRAAQGGWPRCAGSGGGRSARLAGFWFCGCRLAIFPARRGFAALFLTEEHLSGYC